MTSSRRGVVAAAGAAAIWGGMFVISRQVFDRVPPLMVLAIRMSVSAIVLLVVLALVGQPWRLPRRDWARTAAVGFIGYLVSIAAQFLGTQRSGAALASLITTAAPLFTVALAAVTRTERIAGRAWVGLGCGLAALLVIASRSGGGSSASGTWWLIGAALTWGTMGFISRSLVAVHSPFLVSGWACVVASVGAWPAAIIEAGNHPTAALNLSTIGALGYISVISTALAFSLWIYGVSRAGSVASGLAFFAQPVVGAFLGWAILGERLGAEVFVAAPLLALGVLIVSRQPAG